MTIAIAYVVARVRECMQQAIVLWVSAIVLECMGELPMVFCYVYQQERWSVHDSYLLCSVMCTGRSAGVYVIVIYCVLLCVPAGALECM